MSRSTQTLTGLLVLMIGVSMMGSTGTGSGTGAPGSCSDETARLDAVREVVADGRLSHEELGQLAALDCPSWLGPFFLDRLIRTTEGPEGDRHWGYVNDLWNEQTAHRLMESPYDVDRAILWAFVRTGEPPWTQPFRDALRTDPSSAVAAARETLPEGRVRPDVYEDFLVESLMTHPDPSTRLLTLAMLGPGIGRSERHRPLLERWSERETQPDVQNLLRTVLDAAE